MSLHVLELSSIVSTFLELNLIVEPVVPLKSGKEASVYCCRAHPSTGRDQLALKTYRPRSQRSFKNDAVYWEGSMLDRIGGGNTRAARALRAGTRFGRDVQESLWGHHEWEVLQRLHAANLPVPEPIHCAEGAILMDLFACADGSVAPPLITARLSAEHASALFAALCDDVERMLWLDLLHGDLSPYNILWNGESYCIIDFPQAIDPRFNKSALRLLERDLENVGRFCARFGPIPEPALIASEIWNRFQSGQMP